MVMVKVWPWADIYLKCSKFHSNLGCFKFRMLQCLQLLLHPAPVHPQALQNDRDTRQWQHSPGAIGECVSARACYCVLLAVFGNLWKRTERHARNLALYSPGWRAGILSVLLASQIFGDRRLRPADWREWFLACLSVCF